jgi:hypothetical protein
MNSRLTKLAQEKSSAQLQTMAKESLKWLMVKIADLKRTSQIASEISKEKSRQVNKFILGGLYFFYYDAKTKKELPYWDKFPLVLILERYPDGFLGLNLHYLPIKHRIIFMEKLMDRAVLNEDGDIKRIRITYDILNSVRRYKEFQPCLKRYLNSHIRSRILVVQPDEWDIALFLPIQQFMKARPEKVWKESVDQIRKS